MAALVDKVPTVAGAIKTIEEVKKMARHSSHEAHHNNFLSSITGVTKQSCNQMIVRRG